MLGAAIPENECSVQASEIDQMLQTAGLLEMQVFAKCVEGDTEDIHDLSARAFSFYCTVPVPDNMTDLLTHLVKASCLGVLGERSIDVSKWLETLVPSLSSQDSSWPETVYRGIMRTFLLLVRKGNWDELKNAVESIQKLREWQLEKEGEYLKGRNKGFPAATELLALYHLARAVEILGKFLISGERIPTEDGLQHHFGRALKLAEDSGLARLTTISIWIRQAAAKLIESSIWTLLAETETTLSDMIRHLASPDKGGPILELWPAQRDAIYQYDLLKHATPAIVVTMPTSAGKTLLAEFKIVYTLENTSESWVAYIVPTRTLVNQVAVDLRVDLEPLGYRVEKAVPVSEIDPTEEALVEEGGFDILVTTPEKLDLLLRSGRVGETSRKLRLVVFDEADSLRGSRNNNERPLKSEMLLTTLKLDCEEARFLLLAPSIPNSRNLAEWLGGTEGTDIRLEWRPNKQFIGFAKPVGWGKDWQFRLEPLYTSHETLAFQGEIDCCSNPGMKLTKSQLAKYQVAAIFGHFLSARGNLVVYSQKTTYARKIANFLSDLCADTDHPDIELVCRFLEMEYGSEYDLVSLLRKGIAYHHGKVSEEVRFLVEWLMRRNRLRVLVATPTIAYGVNFPISSLILNDYLIGQPPKPMSSDLFWNIAGRVGRAHQDLVGLIVFTNKDDDKDLNSFVNRSVDNLVTGLQQIVIDTVLKAGRVNLEHAFKVDSAWSSFIQYLTHAYRQMEGKEDIKNHIDTLVQATLGYQNLLKSNPNEAQKLLDGCREFSESLLSYSDDLLERVDRTGFSPQSVQMISSSSEKIELGEYVNVESLLQPGGPFLSQFAAMLKQIPEIESKLEDISSDQLKKAIALWVKGVPVSQIAVPTIFDMNNVIERIDAAVDLIHSIRVFGSWGLGALIESMRTNKGFEGLDLRKKYEILSLPAMAYFGIDTLEGMVLCNAGVPRAAAKLMADAFREFLDGSMPSIRKAREWLSSLEHGAWQDEALSNLALDPPDLRKIWAILSGYTVPGRNLQPFEK